MMRMPGQVSDDLIVFVRNGDNQMELRIDSQADISTAVEFLEAEFKKKLHKKLVEKQQKPLQDIKV